MKKLVFSLWALLGVFFVQAQTLTVEKYAYSGAIVVKSPILADSTNIKGKSFSDNNLLETRLDFTKVLQKASVLQADTASKITLSSGNSDYSLHVLAFPIQSQGFQKGKLEIFTNDAAEVYQEEKKLKDKTKETVSQKIDLELSAGKTMFYVKILINKKDSNKHELKVTFTPNDTTASVISDLSTNNIYTIYTMMEGTNIRSARLSHDGKYALLKFSQRKNTQVETYCQLLDTKNGKVILEDKGYLQSANFMPKSNALYFTRKGTQGTELILFNLPDMQQKVLDNNLPDGDFVFTEDEQALIFSLKEEGTKRDESFMQRFLDPGDRIDGYRQRVYLARYGFETGMLERLTFGYQSTYLQAIHPDGKSLVFSTSKKDYTHRPFSTMSLFLLDLNSLSVDTLLVDAPYVNGVSFSPDGNRLLVFGAPDAFDGIRLNIGKEKIANSYDNQLFVFDLASKKARALTKNFNPSVVNAKWSALDNKIYVLAEDRDYKSLFSINPETAEFTQIKTEEEYVKSFSLAQNAPMMLYFGQSVSNADRVYLVSLKKPSGATTCLIDLSKKKLENIVLGSVKDWNFIAADGTEITGRYYLPPYFDSTKTYPLLVYYYGGTSPTSRMFEFSYSMHLYAAQGYVVYTLNPSGTTGFGQEFSARHVNAWGKHTAEEIILGVKKFCQEHSFVDKNKIGCFGASYGGFMTQYLQTQTDIFAAAVSHAGISDITSYWGEGYWGIGYNSIASADSYPWNNKELYVGQSPLFNADKIKTPLLLLHGTVDTNVPVGESIQMYNALKILGKEVEMVQIEGENHGIVDYKKRIAWTNTIMAWFAKYLKGQDAWWESLYPTQKN